MSAEYTSEQFEAIESAKFDAEGTIPMNLSTSLPVPTFPVDALPEWWGRYVSALAESTQTPMDMAGTVTLGVLAAAVGGKYEIEPVPGWVEPTNVYTVVALPPGNRKSAVFAKATGPLKELERELIRERRPIVAEEQARFDLLVDKAERAKRDALKTGDPGDEAQYLDLARRAAETVVPSMPRLLADDATPEAIVSIAASQGGRIAIAAPEGGIFDIFAGRYTGGVANNEVLLRGHAGDSYVIDRKGRESETIDKLTVSFILTVQPSVLRQIGEQPVDKSRGELERFLYCVPLSNVGHRQTRPPRLPESVRVAYEERVTALGRSAWEMAKPLLLVFSDDAQDVFYGWQAEVETMLRLDGDLGDPRLIGWGSKLAGATARFAAILHLAEHGNGDSVISTNSAKGAIALARYYAEHAKAAFQLMQVTDPFLDEKKVLRFIQSNGEELVRARDVFEKSKGTFKKMSVLQPVLGSLVDLGWLYPVEEPERSAGRPRSPLYLVHPDALDTRPSSHNPHNSHNGDTRGSSANTANTANHPRAATTDSASTACVHALPHGECFQCRYEGRDAA